MTRIKIICIFLALMLLMPAQTLAENGAQVSNISFCMGDKTLTHVSQGDIFFKAKIAGSGTARLFCCLFSGSELLDLAVKTVTLTNEEAEYSSGAVTVSGKENTPFVYAMIWSGTNSPIKSVRITPQNHVSDDVISSLKKYDDISDKGIVDFLISLYDAESGGFAVSPSANKTPGFEGELEATATIMIDLPGMGLMSQSPATDPDIPEGFLEKITEFFLSRQSENDGYFYDPYYGNHMIETKRERSSSKTLEVLKMLETSPRYPTYLDRVAAVTLLSGSTLPGHFASEQSYINWMANKNWTSDTYTTGNEITNSLDVAMALGYSDAASAFILGKQNPKTGLWGGDTVTSDSTNGALKLSDALRKLGTPYPYVEEAIDSIIGYIENETSPENICTVWNPLILICNIKATHNNLFPIGVQAKIDEKVSLLLDKTYDHLVKLRTSDGGYKYYPDKPSFDSGGVDCAIGLDENGNIEGNYNSTVIGSYLMRNSAYGVAGVNPIGAWHKYKTYFWEEIEKKMKASNPKYVTCNSYFEDFENETSVSDLYKSWGFIFQKSEGSHVIVTEGGNKFLKVKASPTVTEKGGYDRFTSNFKIPKGESYTLEMKFKVSSDSVRPVFNVFFGPRAAALSILRDTVIGGDGSKMVLMYRTTTGETLSVSNPHFLKNGVEKGVWHTLKIIYTPKGKSDTITNYYLNDELLISTNEYYNGGFAERFPVENIQSVKISAFDRSCDATLFIDDISVSSN